MTAVSLLFVAPPQGGNAGTVVVVQMALIFAIFYFLLIRPQAKERKRHEEMLAAIKKGDEILTNGGVIGTVVHVEESRLTVKTGDNTRLTVDRGGVAKVFDPQARAKEG